MNLPDNFEPGPALERLKSLHDGHIVDNPSWWETCAAIEELAEQAATALRVAADWFKEQQEQWERAEKAEAEWNKWEWVARDIAGAFPKADAILADALSRWQPHQGGKG